MADSDDAAAVRIEIEPPLTGGAPVPGQAGLHGPGQKPPSRLVVGAGVLLALFSVLAIVLLRPDVGETAAGTQRIAPTSAPPTTEAPATTIPPTTTTVFDAPTASVVVAGGLSDVQAIIPWTSSLIALGGGRGDLLRLYSSTDGQVWSRLPTLLIDVDLPETTDNQTVQRFFFALGESDDGGLTVSMLELITTNPDTPEQSLTALTTRLLSEDGIIWSIDDDFKPIDLGEVVGALPLVNTPELTVVGAFRGEEGNPLIAKVLDRYVADTSISEQCWVQAVDNFRTSVELTACDGGQATTLEASQLVDPSTAVPFGRCLVELSGRSGPPLEIFMQRRGETTIRSYFQEGTVFSLPVAMPDGRVAVLAPGRSLDGAPSCEPFDVFDDEAPTDPGVSLLAPGEGSTRLPSLSALPATTLFGLEVNIAATETDIVVPTADGVYAVDIGTGIWSERAQPVVRDQTIWIAPNGEQLFTFAGEQMLTLSADNVWSPIVLDRRMTPDRIIYADADRVFFLDAQELLVIRLPVVE